MGNMVLCAGCIAYVGPFTADYRADLVKTWVKGCQANHIPVDTGFDLIRILANPIDVREWIINALPADDFSVQNGMFAAELSLLARLRNVLLWLIGLVFVSRPRNCCVCVSYA